MFRPKKAAVDFLLPRSLIAGAIIETRLPESDREAVLHCFKKKHADGRFYALAEVLLWKNRAVSGYLDLAEGLSERLNESQVAFASIAMLDLQVPNGGLLQFFWNCLEWAHHVPASLRLISMPELADVFERSKADSIAQIRTFFNCHKRDSLADYSECAGQFDFDDFDSAYFEQNDELYAKSIAFVASRLDDFVQAARPLTRKGTIG